MKRLMAVALAVLFLALITALVLLCRAIGRLTLENDDLRGKLLAAEASATISSSPKPDTNDLASPQVNRTELLRLRGEVTRLRGENDRLKRLRNETSEPASQTDNNPRPAFQHRFLSRSTWTNAGFATLHESLETFIWALTTKNEAALLEASARDSNDQPFRLSGLQTDWDDRVQGVQILSFYFIQNNFEKAMATVVAEMRTQMSDQTGRSYEGVTHMVLRMRFNKDNGGWRFAGRAD